MASLDKTKALKAPLKRGNTQIKRPYLASSLDVQALAF